MTVFRMLSQAKTLSARNAWINPQRKFFPVKWKTLPTNMARRTAVSLAIFSRHVLKQKFYAKPSLNLQFGNATYISFEFSLWGISKHEIQAFIEQANLRHPTIKFTAEISDTETEFLDTAVYVVVQFYPWFKFYFLLSLDMVMYDNEFETKENKTQTKDKIEPIYP